MCGKNQTGRWQRGIATPCRSHHRGPLGAGKAALILTDSSFFSIWPNRMPVKEGGGRPWAPPSLLMDEGGGVWLRSLDSCRQRACQGQDALATSVLLVLLGMSPGHPVVHRPTHPCCDFCLPPAQRGLSLPESPGGSRCQPAWAAQAILSSQSTG